MTDDRVRETAQEWLAWFPHRKSEPCPAWSDGRPIWPEDLIRALLGKVERLEKALIESNDMTEEEYHGRLMMVESGKILVEDKHNLEDRLTHAEAVGRIWKRRANDWRHAGFPLTKTGETPAIPDPTSEEIDAEIATGERLLRAIFDEKERIP